MIGEYQLASADYRLRESRILANQRQKLTIFTYFLIRAYPERLKSPKTLQMLWGIGVAPSFNSGCGNRTLDSAAPAIESARCVRPLTEKRPPSSAQIFSLEMELL
jgi:hypothetical protein